MSTEIRTWLISRRFTEHAADLSAHTYNVYQKLITGQYINPGNSEATVTAPTIAANTLYAHPLLIPRNLTIDRIAVEIRTGDAGKIARLGIYRDGTNLYPGALVIDSGEISVAAIGVVAATVSQALTKELYWLAILSNGVPATNGAVLVPGGILGWSNLHTYVSNPGWSVAQAYGALPDPFTAGGSMPYNARSPLVSIRIASLD